MSLLIGLVRAEKPYVRESGRKPRLKEGFLFEVLQGRRKKGCFGIFVFLPFWMVKEEATSNFFWCLGILRFEIFS